MLKHQQLIGSVTIDTPKGWPLTLTVLEASFDERQARCAIQKDSGDDPDITNGILIFATVTLQEQKGILIKGGKGVGKVTQRGLQIPIGEPAINPVPRQMICREVSTVFEGVFDGKEGIEVCIDIPEGERLAKKTFNPRLGVEGGLSVLGTTGIVEPMSEEALKQTILLELKVLREKGYTSVILVPGNMGEKQVKESYPIRNAPIVQMSNYVGWTLDCAVETGFKEVLIAGHIGKLVKLAGGIFNTHNRVSTTRMELLVTYLALMGAPRTFLEQIMDCKTTDEAASLIQEEKLENVYQVIANHAANHCDAYCFGALKIGVSLFSMKEHLGESDSLHTLLKAFF